MSKINLDSPSICHQSTGEIREIGDFFEAEKALMNWAHLQPGVLCISLYILLPNQNEPPCMAQDYLGHLFESDESEICTWIVGLQVRHSRRVSNGKALIALRFSWVVCTHMYGKEVNYNIQPRFIYQHFEIWTTCNCTWNYIFQSMIIYVWTYSNISNVYIYISLHITNHNHIYIYIYIYPGKPWRGQFLFSKVKGHKVKMRNVEDVFVSFGCGPWVSGEHGGGRRKAAELRPELRWWSVWGSFFRGHFHWMDDSVAVSFFWPYDLQNQPTTSPRWGKIWMVYWPSMKKPGSSMPNSWYTSGPWELYLWDMLPLW